MNRQTGKELPLPWVPHLIDSSPSIWCLFSIPSWSIPRHRFTSDSLWALVSAVSTGACPGRRVTWERGPESEGVRRRRPSAAGAAGREGGTAWGRAPDRRRWRLCGGTARNLFQFQGQIQSDVRTTGRIAVLLVEIHRPPSNCIYD
jgi:hypothetical protein